MPNTKITRRYLLLSILIFMIAFFIIFSAISYLGAIYTSLFARFFVILISAIVSSLLLAFALGYFSATVSSAMIMLRRRMRMDSLSNPLLVRLSTEAPGTYYHSLNVSSIAQRAAKAIGADSLTVRTAAYYHDIGKLSAPDDFMENIYRSKRNDDWSTAELRKKVRLIINHVPEGVKIAEENHLSEEMIDFIREHHGKSKVASLYKEAKERGVKIDQKDFSYPGPIPKSRESAILMLADCVEAAARARSSLTKRSIREIVDSATKEKIDSGDLKNSGLSASQISKIKNSLAESLLAVFHHRVAYDQD
jgi:putative nucleotidyltransferase with HDIG domain